MSASPTLPTVIILPEAGTFTLTLRLPTRAEAEMAFLRAVQPDLADKVARIAATMPELASRVRRAGLLVAAGAVTLAKPGEVMPSNRRYHHTAWVVARVQSERVDAEFLLTRGDLGVIICNCDDAQPAAGEPGAPWSRVAPHTCSHILAAALARRLV